MHTIEIDDRAVLVQRATTCDACGLPGDHLARHADGSSGLLCERCARVPRGPKPFDDTSSFAGVREWIDNRGTWWRAMWDVAAWDVFECDGDGFHFRASVTVTGEGTPRAIQSAYAALGVLP
jgi:hypothetical protein